MQTNQSTANAASYKSSDLQVAKASGTATKSFTMGHKMGLLTAAISTAATSVDNVITYDGNSWNGSTWTSSTKTTLSYYISRTFTSTNKPYVASNTLYYIGEPSANSITFTTSATDSGTTLYYAWTLDSSSSTSTVVGSAGSYKSLTIPAYSGKSFRQKIWNFSYAGAAKTWKAPHTGTYTMEVWGAQGGNYAASGYTAYGGKGAYVKGNISLTSGNTFYVYVGQQPSGYQGGWNGGGTNIASLPSGGGGATDISVSDGAWNAASHLYSRIIVAGGGGGGGMEVASYAWGGGDGGAWAGGDGQGQDPGYGGQLNAAGANGTALMDPTPASFGSCGSGGWGASAPSEPLGAGGGGWYGGGCAGGGQTNGGGGGGSSYAWTTTSNLHTYYPSSSYKPSTSFYLTGVSVTGGSRSGHGTAKITYTNP